MKKRADILIVEKALLKSRNVASNMIKAGMIFANGKKIEKASDLLEENANIEFKGEMPFVGRGGLKLEHALKHWKIDVRDKIALDIGSSTGGFTDCLIKNGAKTVYAIDVGTDQFDKELSKNNSVILMEKTDIRNIKSLPQKPEIVVIDVSFISLEKVLPKAKELSAPKAEIIALFKPQFETPREAKNKSGVIKDKNIYKDLINNIKQNIEGNGMKMLDYIDSPIRGGSGNREFLIHIIKQQ